MLNKIKNWLSAKKKFTKETLIEKEGIVYPTKELVLNLHDTLIEDFRDSNDQINRGILNEGNIDFNLIHVKDIVNVKGKKENIILEKAAHLMNNFVTSHAFVDGNKRIGFALFLLFIIENGINFDSDFSDYVKHAEFIRRIASKPRDERTVKKIMKWFKSTSSQAP